MSVAATPRPGFAAAFGISLRRELQAIARSGWDLLLLLGLPLATIAVLAVMFSPGVFSGIPTAVVDADHSALSRSIVRQLDASPRLRLVDAPTGLPQALSLMRAEKAYNVVYIPPQLEVEHVRGQEAAVLIYSNAALQTVASQGAQAAQQAIGAALQADMDRKLTPLAGLQPPGIQVNIVGNPQTSFELFLETLATPLILAMLLGCAAVYAVGRELADGTLHAWHAASGGRTLAALLGKLAPYVLVYWLWNVLFTAWLAGWRGWPVAGSLPVLLLAQLAFCAVVGAVSALLVGVLRGVDEALSISALYLGSGLSFAGATLTLNGGSWFVRAWSAFLPSTSYVQLQEQQWVMGSPLASGWLPALVLLAFIVVGLAAAVACLGRLARSEQLPDKALRNLPTPRGYWRSLGQTLAMVAVNKPILLTVVIAVLLYGFYYPMAYNMQTVIKVPVAVVDLDRSPLSRSFMRKLGSTREVQITDQPTSVEAAQELLRTDRVDGVILITPDLQKSVLRNTPGGISVYLKGAYLVRARFIGEALRGAIAGSVQEVAAPLVASGLVTSHGTQVLIRNLYNPTNGYGDYVVPGVAAIILQATLLFGVAMFMGLKRERDDWRMTPRAFLGTWSAFTLLGSLMSLAFFGFIFWVQDYPRGGNLAGLLLAVPLFAAAVSALGLLVGSVFERHERSMQILAGTSIPVFLLSGLSWPLFAMPAWLVALAKLVPSTSAVLLFVQLNSMGASVAEVTPRLLALALLSLLFGCAAFLRITHPNGNNAWRSDAAMPATAG